MTEGTCFLDLGVRLHEIMKCLHCRDAGTGCKRKAESTSFPSCAPSLPLWNTRVQSSSASSRLRHRWFVPGPAADGTFQCGCRSTEEFSSCLGLPRRNSTYQQSNVR